MDICFVGLCMVGDIQPPQWVEKGTEVRLYLILLPVGLSPHSPQKLDGRRMLPATSEPMPRMEPPPAIRAPSPPEEPPGVFWWLRGFRVWPKIRLLQS